MENKTSNCRVYIEYMMYTSCLVSSDSVFPRDESLTVEREIASKEGL